MMKTAVIAAKNWKTTTVGVLQFLGVLITALIAQLDGVETTTPDWNLVVASAVALFGFLLARDADKSSEDSGVKGKGRESYIK